MIPKIIHYCWFGPKPIPELEQRYIESWKIFLPDFDLKFWNEQTFDLASAPLFARQAYEHKKYAFVSDYVRMKVLYEYGGLYLDTDLEIIKDIHPILKQDTNVLGFETRSHLGTAIMWFTPKDVIIKLALAYYETNHFVDKKGNIDVIANTAILTDVLTPIGLKNNGVFQEIANIKIYNREYFYPKKLSMNEFRCTDETYAIHRCSNSWMTEKQKKRGNNKFWINVIRPSLLCLRNIGTNLVGKDKIRSVEVWLRNKLK